MYFITHTIEPPMIRNMVENMTRYNPLMQTQIPLRLKMPDNIQCTGSLDDLSEAKQRYKDPNSTRPIIVKMLDHDHLLKVLHI